MGRKVEPTYAKISISPEVNQRIDKAQLRFMSLTGGKFSKMDFIDKLVTVALSHEDTLRELFENEEESDSDTETKIAV